MSVRHRSSCCLRFTAALQVVKALDDTPEAAHTAAVVQEVSAVLREALKHHPVNAQRIADGKNPANVVLLRGCGSRSLPTLILAYSVSLCSSSAQSSGSVE